jgi:hypothetical protein
VVARVVGWVAAWLATRAWVVWLLLGPYAWVHGDVAYFAQSLHGLPGHGLAHTLSQYPLPAVGVLAVPMLLSSVLPAGYAALLLALALATDLGFEIILLRYAGEKRLLAAGAWLVAVPALGPVVFARFDLLPGVLAGAALLLVAHKPRWSAGLAAVGAAVKAWPLLLAPSLLAAARRRSAWLATLVTVGLLLAATCWLLAGWQRLLSPLTYQGGRGLEVEAVPATPALLTWWARPDRMRIHFAPTRSYEFSGAGVHILLVVSAGLVAAYAVLLVVLWWRMWLVRDLLTPAGVAWPCLFAVSGFMATGKVLSPQYFLWLLPLAAAALASMRSRRLVCWCALLVVCAVLTQLEFPVWFAGLSLRVGHVDAVVVDLAVRNLLLAGLTVWAAVESCRLVLAHRSSSSPVVVEPSAWQRAGPPAPAVRQHRRVDAARRVRPGRHRLGGGGGGLRRGQRRDQHRGQRRDLLLGGVSVDDEERRRRVVRA